MGALKILVDTLKLAPILTGVAVEFGEEMIAYDQLGSPRVVIVPVGGPISEAAYAESSDVDLENQWALTETVDIYCFGFAAADGALPLDHADAAVELRSKVLSAWQWQRLNENAVTGTRYGGLSWKPVSSRWVPFDAEITRYGRACVVQVQVEIPIAEQSFVYADATIATVDAPVTVIPPG